MRMLERGQECAGMDSANLLGHPEDEVARLLKMLTP